MALKAKDIAEMLGVSTATVSLVLNNKPGVGAKKREEIIRKIKEMGGEYLLEKKNILENRGVIGFVVYKKVGCIIDESPFFTYILEEITNQLTNYGYSLGFVYLSKDSSVQEQEKQLKTMDYKGFLIFGVEMRRDDLQIFVNSGLPFCVLDNSFQESDVDSVSINNEQGMEYAIRYLCKMGHKNIGYIKSCVRVNSFDERYRFFKRSLKRLGLEFCKEYVVNVEYSEEKIIEGMIEYLKENKNNLPTAFFAENDFLACNALQAIQKYGYFVPQDISLVGFDDRPITQIVTPKITTVNVPKNIFGSVAVEVLMSRLEGGREQSLKIGLGTKLVERESVRKIEV